jgi:hypothetical protein
MPVLISSAYHLAFCMSVSNQCSTGRRLIDEYACVASKGLPECIVDFACSAQDVYNSCVSEHVWRQSSSQHVNVCSSAHAALKTVTKVRAFSSIVHMTCTKLRVTDEHMARHYTPCMLLSLATLAGCDDSVVSVGRGDMRLMLQPQLFITAPAQLQQPFNIGKSLQHTASQHVCL